VRIINMPDPFACYIYDIPAPIIPPNTCGCSSCAGQQHHNEIDPVEMLILGILIIILILEIWEVVT
jgi:hypothetical protein